MESKVKPGWRGRLLGSRFPHPFPLRSISKQAASMRVLGAWEKPLLCPLPYLFSDPFLTPHGMANDVFWCHGNHPVSLPGISSPLSFPSWPGCVPSPPPTHPPASSLHVAEGPGTPQVPCLSNKVETKPGCQATLCVQLWRVGIKGVLWAGAE